MKWQMKKRPVGRPSKYQSEFCDRIIEMAQSGASKHEMALELGIVPSTFDMWQNENEEFSKAVKEAERISQGWWEREGRKATFGGCQGFNATTYIFNMKNRFKDDWKDMTRQENQALDKNGQPTDPPKIITQTILSKLSTEELEAALDEARDTNNNG